MNTETRRVLVAAALLVGLAGCGTTPAPTPGPSDPSEQTENLPEQPEYLPGHSAIADLPSGEPSAVVVLVPGGGWENVDMVGTEPLAKGLVENGLAVVTVGYGNASTDDFYPRPVDDVACAVAYAAQQVPDVPVVLVGHSAGGHLAVMAGLRPDGDDSECTYPARAVDAVVGLAGAYYPRGASAENILGVPAFEDPELQAEASAGTWAAERPDLPFLLVHGTHDFTVPVSMTDDLSAALIAAGHPVTVEMLHDVNHTTIVLPEQVLEVLVGWIATTVTAA